ncbi:protein CHAPERONE-LIKE PROTEIN OF POR1, chloroplastic-like [Brassica napus]|uniref:protein CHAPERONE-LIKE PROTEIN OF POR1, chloroplastic-like n=1 Tax=Brassica napus TaxID=3708 RepID=UPI0006AACAF0|nr:protein CHAPERONE-LIKE PROTEIN OF POR1, chloroplastic-like [Brassica napus]XP_013718188.1 protein CHAPERONE-LIKE PROTEIN OF POR1, chloroplastic-like [Brassica napus]XP_013718189.1 protein CHAPERONE-LIKE PROTEIN OF POR1, chloroplastic-like [Brassica napus]
MSFRPVWYILEKLSIFYSSSQTQSSKCRLSCCSKKEVMLSMIVRAMSDITNRFNRDPYKRLGISKMASEDEIQGARNFLIQQYAGHRPSVNAIESAHDKIIMQKFHERKNLKIDITKKGRQVRQSKAVNFVFERFQTPPTAFLVKTAVTFTVLGALTVLFPTEEGPTLQVLLSLISSSYVLLHPPKAEEEALVFSFTGRDLSSSRG